MKVVIYSQISTDRGEQNIRQQVVYVREFCKRKGYDIYKVYKDEKPAKPTNAMIIRECYAIGRKKISRLWWCRMWIA